MAAEKIIKFYTGTASEYASVVAKDPYTLYFISDERKIYKGDVPYSGGSFVQVASYPPVGTPGVLYINTTDGSVSYWDNEQSEYVQVIRPTTTQIPHKEGEEPNNFFIPTEKAVYDYITKALEEEDLEQIRSDIEDLQENKADWGETLADYGITDAYTKSEVEEKINSAGHLKRQIVEALPEVDEADPDIIYMVLKDDEHHSQGEHQVYDEYMIIEGEWERIGDTAVDLADYVTRDELEEYTEDTLGDLNYQDAETDLEFVTSVSQEDGLINVTHGTIAESEQDGYININGTDVYIHGLDSAAFTSADAYDKAGDADQALLDAKEYIEQLLIWRDIVGDNEDLPITYTVTFEMNGHGTPINAETVLINGTVTKPQDPTEEGYDFMGWYSNQELTIPFNFETTQVTSDLTIYASWLPMVKLDGSTDIQIPMQGLGD